MKFELFIASRYLRAKRRQAVIGIITAISIAGVTAGVASLIIALAINNGFRQDLQNRLLGSTSHVQLLRVESDGIRTWQPLLARLSKEPHVTAASPAIYEQVLVSRGARAKGAILKGILPEYERKVSDMLKNVTVGSPAALEPQPAGAAQTTAPTSPDSLARTAAFPPIVLGKEMADDLGATVGSVVMVISPQGELTPFGLGRDGCSGQGDSVGECCVQGRRDDARLKRAIRRRRHVQHGGVGGRYAHYHGRVRRRR